MPPTSACEGLCGLLATLQHPMGRLRASTSSARLVPAGPGCLLDTPAPLHPCTPHTPSCPPAPSPQRGADLGSQDRGLYTELLELLKDTEVGRV